MPQVPKVAILKSLIRRSPDVETNGTGPAQTNNIDQHTGKGKWRGGLIGIGRKNANDSSNQGLALTVVEAKARVVITTIKCCTVIIVVLILTVGLVAIAVAFVSHPHGKLLPVHGGIKEALGILTAATTLIFSIGAVCIRVTKAVVRWIGETDENE